MFAGFKKLKSFQDDSHKEIFVKKILLKGKRVDIARMLTCGAREKDIADSLHMSLVSIKKHIFIMKEKMGCTTLHGLSACLALVFYEIGEFDI